MSAPDTLAPLTGEQMLEITVRWQMGEDWREIALAVGLSLWQTLEHGYRMGIYATVPPAHVVSEARRKYRRWGQEENTEFAKMWKRGDAVVDIARKFDCTPSAVYQRVERNALPSRRRGRKKGDRYPAQEAAVA